ncbi:hypothetical protein [Streptomyces sp. NPDC056468]|uniref:hypothetical protein n=1 Tax=Streptomyces sp. NPDC056468 TaxID=3345830 RepID=UPI0036BFDDE9
MKLSAVLSDVAGTSGQAILENLIAGERDPGRLADLAVGQARNKIPALIEALDGEQCCHTCGSTSSAGLPSSFRIIVACWWSSQACRGQ